MDVPPSSLQRLAAAISAVVVAAQESGLADSEVVSEVVTEVVMAAAARYVSRHSSQEIGSCLMRWSERGRGRGRGKFIVIVLPTFAGLKVTYNVLD